MIHLDDYQQYKLVEENKRLKRKVEELSKELAQKNKELEIIKDRFVQEFKENDISLSKDKDGVPKRIPLFSILMNGCLEQND